LQWRGRQETADVPPFLKELAQTVGVSSLQWKVS
jgi:hypothetical protein